MDMNIVMRKDSLYLTKDDVPMTGVDMVIANVTIEEVGDEQKPVINFMGGSKGMVANKVNVGVLCSLYGAESDAWSGKIITLFNDPSVQFQGKLVGGIRLRPSMSQPAGVNIAQNSLQGAPAPLVDPNGQQSPPVDAYTQQEDATGQSLAQFQDSDIPF